MTRALAVFTALVLAGCQSVPEPAIEPTKAYALNSVQVDALASAFQTALLDPYSMQTPIIYAKRGMTGTIYVCGLVNAKNSFGAYTGAKPFYAIGISNRFQIIALGGTEAQTYAAYHMCRRMGFPI